MPSKDFGFLMMLGPPSSKSTEKASVELRRDTDVREGTMPLAPL